MGRSVTGNEPVPRRILFLTTNYGDTVRGTPLSNDLISAFISLGHSVHVMHLDWSASPKDVATESGLVGEQLTVTRVPAQNAEGRFGQIRRWIFSSPSAAWRDRKKLSQDWDLVVALSPLTAMAAPILSATRNARCSYCYITDFFPFHHADLGLLPRGIVTRAAAYIENALLGRFDVIGCMSPAGEHYLTTHYRIKKRQLHEVLHLWSNQDRPRVRERRAVRQEWGVPEDALIAVFGGQLAPGRSLDAICQAAMAAQNGGNDITFLVVGDGPGREQLESYAANCDNLTVYGGVCRDRYFELLTACDIGIIATTASVSAPTFPSKSIDYLRAGLPIVATTEKSSDFGEFIESHRVGRWVTEESPAALLNAITDLAQSLEKRDEISMRAQSVARDLFSADCAASQILSHLNSR